jgi:hypothetical protein
MQETCCHPLECKMAQQVKGFGLGLGVYPLLALAPKNVLRDVNAHGLLQPPRMMNAVT